MGPHGELESRPDAAEAAADVARMLAEETLRQGRVDRALQKGWTFRWDPVRDEYSARRVHCCARELDTLLDMIEGTE